MLAYDQLKSLVDEGHVVSPTSSPEIGSSAIDLCLGSNAWILRTGQRPTTRELAKIKDQSQRIQLTDGKYFEFERGQIYIVQLDQHLNLPGNVSGRASGKSSIGRLDVITRLITDRVNEYDLVAAGYEGQLHLLLMPQTFTIHVAPGKSLNQLRLFSGAHSSSVITRDQLYDYGERFWYTLKEDRSPHPQYEEWLKPEADATGDPGLMDLTVDLGDPRFPYVYRAKKNIDAPIDLSKKSALRPEDFFEEVEVKTEGRDKSVVLEHDSFYIMKSRERLYIPSDVAVEVVAISERIGDIRIHYAGFAHPGFGLEAREPSERLGTPLIFEVRATDMATKLYHKSLLARIQLFRMSKPSSISDSAYGKQELKLSNVFADPQAQAVKA